MGQTAVILGTGPIIEHVTDLPTDLPRLRVIETYLLVQLQQVREAIRVAEQRQRQQADADEQARRRRAADDRAARRKREAQETAAELVGPSAGRPERDPGRIPRGDGVRWWYIEPAQPLGTHPHPAYLHRGDCPNYRHRGQPGFTRDEARLALADQQNGVPTVEPCPRCRPDFGLE